MTGLESRKATGGRPAPKKPAPAPAPAAEPAPLAAPRPAVEPVSLSPRPAIARPIASPAVRRRARGGSRELVAPQRLRRVAAAVAAAGRVDDDTAEALTNATFDVLDAGTCPDDVATCVRALAAAAPARAAGLLRRAVFKMSDAAGSDVGMDAGAVAGVAAGAACAAAYSGTIVSPTTETPRPSRMLHIDSRVIPASFISGSTLRIDGARPQVRLGWPMGEPADAARQRDAVKPFNGFHRAQTPKVFS